MSYVMCLIYCIGIRLDLILLVYVNLFQHYHTGATTKTSLSDVVSVEIKKLKKRKDKKTTPLEAVQALKRGSRCRVCEGNDNQVWGKGGKGAKERTLQKQIWGS